MLLTAEPHGAKKRLPIGRKGRRISGRRVVSGTVGPQPEPSSAIRERVNAAREVQKKRFAGTEVSCNAYMTPAMIGQYCALDAAGEKLMQGAFERLGLTARSHDRILRMARTIADLEGSERIEAAHLAEAIQYRSSSTLK